MNTVKIALRRLLSLGMIFAGIMHFRATDAFASIVPDYLPAHRLLVQLSGGAEIALGLGLGVPRLSRACAWGLIALYIAVFPANINMAVDPRYARDLHITPLVLWLRLPLQFLLIGWAAWYTRPEPRMNEDEL